MFSISIVAALISGIIGLIRMYGGVDWLVNSIEKRIKTRKGAEYGIGLMSGVLSAALVNNTIGIIVTCPMAGVSPIAVLKHSYYMFFLIIAVCVTIQLGLLRGKEEGK